MLQTLQNSLHSLRLRVVRLLRDPRAQGPLKLAVGFLLSAASLGNLPQPFVLALVLALKPELWTALGGMVGYLVFWGAAGRLGLVWLAVGLPLRWLLELKPGNRGLLPAVGGLLCAAADFLFPPGMGMQLLHTAVAAGSVWLFATVLERRDTVADWTVAAVAVLALAQVAPLPMLSLGYPAAAALTVCGAFPMAAMAGLALDLAGVTEVSMTAALSLAWLSRFFFRKPLLRAVAPGVSCVVLSLLRFGTLLPVPGLLVGGALGLLLPGSGGYVPRRGEVGVAQVRLELAAAALRQLQGQLLELPLPTVDTAAVLEKTCENACAACSVRRNCPGRVQLQKLAPDSIYRSPESLHIACRRTGRLYQELRRGQEQLRLMGSANSRAAECRSVLVNQYRDISQYLQGLSDELSRRGDHIPQRYRMEVSISGNRPESQNGDRCVSFSGTLCRAFVLLCDGMGTGLGAVEEGRWAAEQLKSLLTAGYPTEHALQLLNTFCVLRGQAGAVTVDLAQVHLDTGRVDLFKWGAAPSRLYSDRGCEKIGTAAAPPGLSVGDIPDTPYRLSLRRGEVLVMCSDGADGEEAASDVMRPPEVLAAELLARCDGHDDATVVTVRLQAI